MKKLILLSAVISTIAVMAGCVFSVCPLYTTSDLVYDPALVGVWDQDERSINSWTFEQADATSYKLIVAEGDRSSPFVAHLVQLGGRRFLDICPDEAGLAGLQQTELFKAGLIRGHLILKVMQLQPTLQLTLMDDNWLGKLLKNKPDALAHQKEEGGSLVLTASTKALQEFMLKNWGTEGAWSSDSGNLTRRRPSQPSKP